MNLKSQAKKYENNTVPTPTRSEEKKTENKNSTSGYPVHKNILATVFWVGEKAKTDNGFISNDASAWDRNWVVTFGGEDTPNERNGYFPEGFTPKENPFYIALPYNDIQAGKRKSNASQIPWSKGDTGNTSILKNRWVKVMFGGNTCYGQWQDVGPFNTNDFQYVFHGAKPAHRVGLDVSPALRDCLDMTGQDYVNWQFVEDKDVPPGPWKNTVTK